MNVFPRHTVLNLPYGVDGYAMFNGDYSMRPSVQKDVFDALVSELAESVSFTARMSVFAHCVVRVVLGGPQKQMRVIGAASNVALVKNVQAIRDWSIRNFPSKSMDTHVTVDNRRFPVPILVKTAKPNKAACFCYSLAMRLKMFLQSLPRYWSSHDAPTVTVDVVRVSVAVATRR